MRERIRRRSARSDEGSVVLLIALSLGGLVAMLALVVDAGVALGDRRRNQNVADHAALASAFASCSGRDAAASGVGSVVDNGLAQSEIALQARGTHEYRARVETDRMAIFAQLLGIDFVTTHADAVARCRSAVAAAGHAIFAASTICPDTLDWPGSTTRVVGDAHSNHRARIPGSDNTLDGALTYATSLHIGGSGNALATTPAKTGVRPLPISVQIQDFAPGGTRAAAAGARYYSAGADKIDAGWLISRKLLDDKKKTISPGLYYSESDIDISSSDLRGTATFVSRSGVVKISGSNQRLEAFDGSGILAYSQADRPCGSAAVAVAGGGSTWTGVLFAPKGLVEMSGSSNSTLAGSLVGDEVRLNGSELEIRSDPGGSSAGVVVELLE